MSWHLECCPAQSVLLALLCFLTTSLLQRALAAAADCPPFEFNAQGNILRCQQLSYTCVDQDRYVSFDPELSPFVTASSLPVLPVSPDLVYNVPDKHGIGDKYVAGQMPIFPSPPNFRYGTTDMEEAPDLQSPQFSKCTVPIVIYHPFPFNAAETFRMTLDAMFALLLHHYFTRDATLVFAYPPGTSMPGYTKFWFQPLSNYNVTTFSHFSARMAPGTPSNSTSEGVHHRCFEKMAVCQVLNQSPHGAQWWSVVQYIISKYQHQLDSQGQRLGTGFELSLLQDPKVMKVVFSTRASSTTRTILNQEELLRRCNQQDLKLPAGSTWNRLYCFTHIFGGDLLQDMWLMRQTDVLVGMHGAQLTNGMFQKEGSSIIEIRPRGLTWPWYNVYFRNWGTNNRERPWKVHWYGVMTRLKNNSRPGLFEIENKKNYLPMYYRRDRHSYVPWNVFAQHIHNIAVASRRLSEYLAVRISGKHYLGDSGEAGEPIFHDLNVWVWADHLAEQVKLWMLDEK